MSRGRRYESEPKLNLKKVFAVVIALVVIIMIVCMIVNIVTNGNKDKIITSESYFAVFENDKWGVINSKGDTVIAPSYAELIVIPNNKKDVFLCTYDVDYSTGTYKTKVLNSENQEIYTDYDQVEPISNMDENQNLWYENNVLRVQKNGKYGLIDLSGKELLKMEYDNIDAVQGIESALRVVKDGQIGIVDNQGQVIVGNAYAEITNLGDDNKDGYIVKTTDGKYGIVDYSNNIVLEPKYEAVSKVYGNDLYVVTENGKEKVVKKDGSDVITSGFSKIIQISKQTGDNAGVVFEQNGKYGYMNVSGQVVLPANYDLLKESSAGVFIAMNAGKYGIIGMDGSTKVDIKYTSILYDEIAGIYTATDETYNDFILDDSFEVKLTGILMSINDEKAYIKMRINDEYKYYNFKFEEKNVTDVLTSNTLFLSKKDGKYGFVDKSGNIVVDYIYDDAMDQNAYGYAAVKKDGKWGAIGTDGKEIVEPMYELDNYLVIDFIGRWHKGLDLNMNYYEQ